MELRMNIEELLLDDWMNLGSSGNVFLSSADEYEQYSSSSHDLSVRDPIEWWKSQASIFPRLSRMASDIFSISAMSAECKQVFSSAKLMIPDSRNRLGADLIEVGKCLKSWEAAGIIDW